MRNFFKKIQKSVIKTVLYIFTVLSQNAKTPEQKANIKTMVNYYVEAKYK